MKKIVVRIEPRVLVWLRERSGWTQKEVAKKLDTTPEIIRRLESGRRDPTLGQLKKLALAFKCPLASFFLPEPKKEKPLPKDYRSLPNKKDVFDRKTMLAIRRSRSLQNLGMELSKNIKYDVRPKITRVSIKDNPDIVASKYRESFDFTWEKQKRFTDGYKMFSHLRKTLEDLHILIFKFSMPIEDARGFVLVDESPAVIAISSKDSIEAQLFTLMHEFGHVLLGETSIDMPEESSTAQDSVERWCNRFASSFLLPLQETRDIFDKHRQHLTDTETLNSLSKKCKVSKATLLRRMLSLRYISQSQHKNVLGRYKADARSDEKNKPARKIYMSSPRSTERLIRSSAKRSES